MPEHGLSPRMKQFVARHCPSMDHVQILLVLQSTAPAQWSRDKLVTETKVAPAVADITLKELVAGGLAASVATPEGEAFTYAPSSEALRRDVAEIATMYNERPVTLVRAVYDRPPEPAVSFADAFSLRKSEP